MATPIVICGLKEVVGSRVAAKMKPEYERLETLTAIQFITSTERAKREIAALQAGQAPAPDPDNVGTHNFSRRPEAILFGRGFDGAAVKDIWQACGGEASKLVWVHAEEKDVARLKAQMPQIQQQGFDPDKYTDMTTRVLKELLAQIRAEGKWEEGGLFTYGM